jgi:hypothetical protein
MLFILVEAFKLLKREKAIHASPHSIQGYLGINPLD